MCCALGTALHGIGLAQTLMGRLSSSTTAAQTPSCDRRMTRDFQGLIRDSKLPTTLRQETYEEETSGCAYKEHKICKLNVRNSKCQRLK